MNKERESYRFSWQMLIKKCVGPPANAGIAKERKLFQNSTLTNIKKRNTFERSVTGDKTFRIGKNGFG